MYKIGQRIVEDRAAILQKRKDARAAEVRAIQLYREADEMERVLDLARQHS